MTEMVFVRQIEPTISISADGAIPIPTASLHINMHTGEEFINLCIGENGTIIGGSHSIPPSQVSDWLEPERSTNRSGSSIVPQIPTKSIVYYTHHRVDRQVMLACQKQLLKCGWPIVSVSLKPLEFGHNIVVDGEPGPLTLFRQQLAGLEATNADWIWFAEHDCLYHPSHFDLVPWDKEAIYYNTNCWKIRLSDGHAVWTDDLQQVSGICAARDILIDFYMKRIADGEANGFDRHYEPNERFGYKTINWQSEWPNLDIRHDHNMTKSKWSPDEFRNKRYARGWKEADEVPGWGVTKGRIWEILESIA